MKKNYDNEIDKLGEQISTLDLGMRDIISCEINNILLLIRLQSLDIKPYEKILREIIYYSPKEYYIDRHMSFNYIQSFSYLDIYKNFMKNKNINNKYLAEHAKQLQDFFNKIDEIDNAKELLDLNKQKDS